MGLFTVLSLLYRCTCQSLHFLAFCTKRTSLSSPSTADGTWRATVSKTNHPHHTSTCKSPQCLLCDIPFFVKSKWRTRFSSSNPMSFNILTYASMLVASPLVGTVPQPSVSPKASLAIVGAVETPHNNWGMEGVRLQLKNAQHSKKKPSKWSNLEVCLIHYDLIWFTFHTSRFTTPSPHSSCMFAIKLGSSYHPLNILSSGSFMTYHK